MKQWVGAAGREYPSIKRKRRWVFWFVAALCLLAIAYTAFWFYAVGRAGREIDAWIAGEAETGRTWTCTDRRFTGYPLQIALSCRAFGFRRRGAAGADVALSSGPIDASVALYDPNHVAAVITGPLHLRGEGGVDVALNWAGLRIDANGPLRLDRATLQLKGPKAHIAAGGLSTSLEALEVRLALRTLLGGTSGAANAQVQLDVARLAAPLLDDAFGNKEPADVSVVAILSEALALRGRGGPEALENWRVNGGRLAITDGTFAKGMTHLDSTGQTSLDAAHRVQGDLTISFSGMENLMRRFRIPVGAVSVGNLLAGFLGNKAPAALSDEPTSSKTTLPLRLGDGHVSLGPIPLPIKLKPLY